MLHVGDLLLEGRQNFVLELQLVLQISNALALDTQGLSRDERSVLADIFVFLILQIIVVRLQVDVVLFLL